MRRKPESKAEATVARRTQKITLGTVLDAQEAQIIRLRQRIKTLENRVAELERRLLVEEEK